MSKIKIAIIAGGWSAEREVSIKSGRAVANALDKDRYNVIWLDPKYDLDRLVQNKQGLDLAFVLLHGRYGEDGCMQGLLEVLGIPYIGSGVLSSAMALNKRVAKKMYRLAGLELPRDVVIRATEPYSVGSILEQMGNKRVVVKPVREGSSLGISICDNEAQLSLGIEKALEHDREVLIEEFIEGTEVTCCVLGNDELMALPIVEIVPEKEYEFFAYEAKYTPGAAREICPARLEEDVKTIVEQCAKSAHRALECRTWSRTDMIIGDGTVYVLETNTIPGMTENSLFPLAAKAAGMSLGQLVDRLVSLTTGTLADPR